MKKAVFFLCCFLSCTHVFAQSFHFTDTGNKWKTLLVDVERSLGFNTYMLRNDSISMSVASYKVREDRANHRVYMVAYEYPDYDTAEHLLYDFNLVVGDTLRTHHAKHYVYKVDTIQIDGIASRVWDLRGAWRDGSTMFLGHLTDYKVIEHVGSVLSPIFPDRPFWFEGGDILVCFENNGRHPVITDTAGILSNGRTGAFDKNTSCNKAFGVGVASVSRGRFAVSPNPCTTEISLTFSSSYTGTLLVSDITGRLVTTERMANADKQTINVTNWQPGVYLYQLTDENGRGELGRFVKQ